MNETETPPATFTGTDPAGTTWTFHLARKVDGHFNGARFVHLRYTPEGTGDAEAAKYAALSALPLEADGLVIRDTIAEQDGQRLVIVMRYGVDPRDLSLPGVIE